mmetsp:Transcript_30819/g.79849  ORF Transcript_30819/g.79849 Transcript_30819/m.79849 type:complete len:204 (-) Transcript_30819:153-764(-)
MVVRVAAGLRQKSLKTSNESTVAFGLCRMQNARRNLCPFLSPRERSLDFHDHPFALTITVPQQFCTGCCRVHNSQVLYSVRNWRYESTNDWRTQSPRRGWLIRSAQNRANPVLHLNPCLLHWLCGHGAVADSPVWWLLIAIARCPSIASLTTLGFEDHTWALLLKRGYQIRFCDPDLPNLDVHYPRGCSPDHFGHLGARLRPL